VTPPDPITPVFQSPVFDSPQSSDGRPQLVVDAANVIGSRPDGWWKDRAGAARRLLADLAEYHQGSGADTDITVILEGAARPAADAVTPTSDFQVIQAAHSGDDAIVEAVAAAFAETPTREITVVTADRGLRARVEPLGAVTAGPNWLYSRLGDG
jgi:predicted RNA-binding protein with PIN domain